MNEWVFDDFGVAAAGGGDTPDVPVRAWRVVSDRVMGGLSTGDAAMEWIDGRRALRLTGRVSLENDGGFLQIARDFADDGGPVDLSTFGGLALDVYGRGGVYGVHLRTVDLVRPWQSFRAAIEPREVWQRVRLPFSAFAAHRTDVPFDPRRLRRIGIVAIGRAFEADIALARLALYRDD